MAQTCAAALRCPEAAAVSLGHRRRRTSTVAAHSRPSRGRVELTSNSAAGSVASGNSRSSSAGRSGGGVIVLPGFFLTSRLYTSMVSDLQRKGFDAHVMHATLSDWLPIMKGGSFEWYVSRLDALLAEMYARHGRVALVGHSAGGWIARLLLGSEPYQGGRYGRCERVHTLLTLGTPHQSTENYPLGKPMESLVGPHLAEAPAGVRGSSLQFANYFYPDVASLGGDVRVVCACGDAIRGRPLWGGSSTSNGSSGSGGSGSGSGGSYASSGEGSSLEQGRGHKAASRWDAYMAYEGYKSGCGRGDVDGDGVTPLCIAHLPGAETLILPDVWHIPRRGHLWYGDNAAQERWLPYIHEQQGSPAGLP